MVDSDRLMTFFTSYLGINPSVGCRNGCAYCVLEKDVPNPKKTVRKASAKFTLDMLLNDRRVAKHNPLSFYNLSDPFLKENIDDLLYILEGLEKEDYHNIVTIITKLNPQRVAPEKEALQRIAALKKLKPVIMVSYANLPKKIEPISKSGRLELMVEAKKRGIPVLQYARPIWEKWTPRDKIQEMVGETAKIVDGVVLGGIVVTQEIKGQLKSRNVIVPPWDNDKGRYLKSNYRQFVIDTFKQKNPDLPIFLNSSCGISYAAGAANYSGYFHHFSRLDKDGFCQRPCHPDQRERCSSAQPAIKREDEPKLIKKEEAKVEAWVNSFGIHRALFQVEDGYLNVFAKLRSSETRMLRQHLGMFVYSAYNFKTFKNQPSLFK